MAGIDTTYKEWCDITKPPKATNNAARAYDTGGPKSTFQDYLALNSFQYLGLDGLTSLRTSAGEVVDSTAYHEAVWTNIATELVNRYHGDRTGKAYPKGSGGASFKVGFPPMGHIVPVPDATAVLNGDSKFGDTVKLIVNWFKANWEEGQKAGKTAKATRNSGVANGALKAGGAKTQANAVQLKFSEYWTKRQFGVGGGVPLPASMQPKDRTMTYFPNLAPHKDAEMKIEESATVNRKGTIGFCIGPVNRNVKPIEVKGETTTIRDGNTVYDKVPVYEVEANPNDKNYYLMDDPLYLTQLQTINGYTAFRTKNPEFTGLPIDGKEMKIPIFHENSEMIQFDADENPIPLREVSADPKAYNLGLNTAGKLDMGALYTTGKTNPGYGKPIDDPALGAITCVKFPINQSNEHGIVSEWIAANGSQVLGGNTMGDAWGAGSGGGNNFPAAIIKFWQPNIKAINPENNLSYSDPRNWGPYTENTRHTVGDNAVGDNGVDVVDGEQVQYTVQWKYVIPNLTAMKSAAVEAGGNNSPGVPAHGSEACYPEMNKQYWGLRLAEVYPPPLDPFDEATKKPSGGASAVVVNGTGGVKKGAYYCAGPAPPFTVKEANSPAMSATFKFSNENFFKVKPSTSNQKPFDRDSPNAGINKNWFRQWPKYMAKVIEYEKKVKGTAGGGMTYFDAAKQIIPPYAPPPLKPPLPNNKKFKFEGVL
jgi:hypothetical protein